MFCENCGAQVQAGDVFCASCGAAVSAPQQSAPQQPVYQQPTYQQPPYQQPAYQQPSYQQPTYQQTPNGYTPVAVQPQLPMNWYKFLIYFALFAGAVLNFINGISLLTGLAYGEAADLVYKTFDGLEGFDMAIGFLSILLAGFGIFVRFQLSGYKKNAAVMLLVLNIAAVVVGLIYVLGVNAFLSSSGVEGLDLSSNFSSIATNLAMAIANFTYLKKREHLFVN